MGIGRQPRRTQGTQGTQSPQRPKYKSKKASDRHPEKKIAGISRKTLDSLIKRYGTLKDLRSAFTRDPAAKRSPHANKGGRITKSKGGRAR